jgi:protein-tyrosine-phosphatase
VSDEPATDEPAIPAPATGAAGRVYNVLFLCTGNSARSILAEALLGRLGARRFRAWSAGSHPKGAVHPMALALLRERGYDTSGLRSKSWDELARPGAPALDFVFTVCDDAARETCPVWPGQPMTAHWGVEDPAAFVGCEDEQRWVFRRVYRELERRIELFTSLGIESLDRLSLQARLDEIGKTGTPAGEGD